VYLIKKYISLLAMFAKNSLAGQLEYRINFICGILVETGYMIAKVAYVVLIYTTGLEIEGMSADEMLVIIGTYAIVTGIYMSFYPNFVSIGNHVRSGTLDFLIVKPVSTLFILTSRFIDFAMPIPNILAGIVMICVGCRRSHVVINDRQNPSVFCLLNTCHDNYIHSFFTSKITCFLDSLFRWSIANSRFTLGL
jgi:ABC-2 type transport system permease protein